MKPLVQASADTKRRGLDSNPLLPDSQAFGGAVPPPSQEDREKTWAGGGGQRGPWFLSDHHVFSTSDFREPGQGGCCQSWDLTVGVVAPHSPANQSKRFLWSQ